jgi:hypothetical protein
LVEFLTSWQHRTFFLSLGRHNNQALHCASRMPKFFLQHCGAGAGILEAADAANDTPELSKKINFESPPFRHYSSNAAAGFAGKPMYALEIVGVLLLSSLKPPRRIKEL